MIGGARDWPVRTEIGRPATPLRCGRRPSSRSRNTAMVACGSSTKSHLLAATTRRARLRRTVRDGDVLLLQGALASTKSTTTSAWRSAASADRLDSCSRAPGAIRARRRSPAVSTSSGRPCHCQATVTASRVSPGSGPVSRRSSSIRRLIKEGCRRSAGRRWPCAAAARRPPPRVLRGGVGQQRLGEASQTLAVLRRNRHRRPGARCSPSSPGLPRPALALVRDQDHRGVRPAQPAGGADRAT